MSYVIISSKVSHGELGEKDLGYPPYNFVPPERGIRFISAHAPSQVTIEVNEEISLRGYSSPSIEVCPRLTFYCDEEELGTLDKSGKQTKRIILYPGQHTLRVETSTLSWAHSVWLFSKKFLNIDPRFPGRGLFNQYLNFLNCLFLASASGRDLVTPLLETDYRKNTYSFWGEFIDIKELNNLLQELGINTQVREKVIEGWEVDPNADIMYGVSLHFSELTKYLSDKEEENLAIGCALPLSIVFPEEERNLFNTLHREIRYTRKVEEVVNYCMTFLGENFSAVHLRAEDDWLFHLSQCCPSKSIEEHGRNILKKYLDKMRKEINGKVYLATYLGKVENKCNYFLDLLKEFDYVTNIPWREKFNLPKGREVDALIDSLICRRAKLFIGTAGSSFSSHTGSLVAKSFLI